MRPTGAAAFGVWIWIASALNFMVAAVVKAPMPWRVDLGVVVGELWPLMSMVGLGVWIAVRVRRGQLASGWGFVLLYVGPTLLAISLLLLESQRSVFLENEALAPAVIGMGISYVIALALLFLAQRR
ncbi:MAG: hypothetical protein ACYS0E_13720 [Planctomycetota bacterium]